MRDLGLHKLALFLLDSAFLGLCQTRGRHYAERRQKILVIRLDAIGDFVLWLDSARALRTIYPWDQYELTLLGNSLWVPLAEDTGIFDAVWPLDRKDFIWNPFYRFRQLLRVRRSGFDLVLNPVHSRELSYDDALTRASGALTRIGSQGDLSNGFPLLKKVSDRWYSELLPAGERKMMELQRQAEFIRGLGCSGFKSSIPNLEAHYNYPAEFSQDGYFVVVPGASSPNKQWGLENFAVIAKAVYDLTGLTAVVCGAKSESSLGEYLVNAHPELFQNWAGKTSLRELVAIIGGAEFILGNDTGAIHIAAAVGVPSICILGGGHFGRFLPYHVDDQAKGKIPLPVYMPMDCFNCNWQCRFEISKGDPFPCVAKVELNAVWNVIRQILP